LLKDELDKKLDDDKTTSEELELLEAATELELLGIALELETATELELPKGQELLNAPPEGHSRKGPVRHILFAIRTQ